MSDEILVNVTPMETRVAIVENGVLQEIMIERSRHRGLVGNIYRGKVVRVLPGMQAAFLDIGLERTGFISASDLQKPDGELKDITELLREGQVITVQIMKDPIGSKGARLTAFLSLSSRYLVYMPDIESIGISQRIADEPERERLKALTAKIALEEFPDLKGHFIIRTAAENIHEPDLKKDMQFLNRLWSNLKIHDKDLTSQVCLYQDHPIFLKILRDKLPVDIQKIRVDSRETLQKMMEFCEDFLPDTQTLLEWYPGERPIFELYSIEDEIQRALGRKVELKSGGYLIIDQTEAMTTIDVNTGAYVGYRNLDETIFKTNLEAATALARQLRLRNLGGIIIVDFIDMQDEEHRRQLLRNLEKALDKDFTRTTISGVTELGLVQIVRKRTRESLEQMLSENCAVCEGRGTVKSVETVCYEIFRAILREARAYNHDAYLVVAAQSVIDRLLDEESANVADLEEFIGKTLRFQSGAMYSPERFDVILL
jgi:ribonuclease G